MADGVNTKRGGFCCLEKCFVSNNNTFIVTHSYTGVYLQPKLFDICDVL